MVELVLTVGVLAFVGFRLAGAARHSFTAAGRSQTLPIVRGIRWHHVWPAPIVLTLVLVVASVLLLMPGLDWGWWSALGGAGNPVTGTTEQTSGTPLEWIVPIVFLALLLPAIPLFALAEERAVPPRVRDVVVAASCPSHRRIRPRPRDHRHPDRRRARPVRGRRLLHALLPAGLPP